MMADDMITNLIFILGLILIFISGLGLARLLVAIIDFVI